MKTNQNIDNHSNTVAIGVKNLDKIGDNDRAFTIEMLNKFINAASNCAENINKYLKRNDWPKLRSVAHKNIPSYRLMGLSELADSLKYIEHNALKKEKRKHISQIAKAIREKNADIIAAIKKYLDLIYIEDLKLNIN